MTVAAEHVVEDERVLLEGAADQLIAIGVLVFLLGGVWLLQGINILPGSFMTGQSFWAVVGAILVIVGAILFFFGLRRKPANPQV